MEKHNALESGKKKKKVRILLIVSEVFLNKIQYNVSE